MNCNPQDIQQLFFEQIRGVTQKSVTKRSQSNRFAQTWNDQEQQQLLRV